jgi:hypothetical protein
MFNCVARLGECNGLTSTAHAMRDLMNQTYLTNEKLLSPNFYDCVLCDAHFELLSVVIRYFIAEIRWKTFKLEILILDPKMGVLGISPLW